MRLHSGTVLLLMGMALGAGRAHAQGDYRNLDVGRPITVEDAQPVEFRALEMELGIPHFVRDRRGFWSFSFEREGKFGLARNLQVGYGSEYIVAHEPGNTVLTSRDMQLHLLYNFNQETRRMPAIAIRPEMAIRAGGLGSKREHGALKLIVSKTVGRNRVHLNGSYTVGPTARPGLGGEHVNRFFYGAAYERTLPLKFVVFLADVYARKPIDHSRTEVVFEAGVRVQIHPKWVLDAGISTGKLRPSVGPDIGFTFGLSRTFSFRWLYPKHAQDTLGSTSAPPSGRPQ